MVSLSSGCSLFSLGRSSKSQKSLDSACCVSCFTFPIATTILQSPCNRTTLPTLDDWSPPESGLDTWCRCPHYPTKLLFWDATAYVHAWPGWPGLSVRHLFSYVALLEPAGSGGNVPMHIFISLTIFFWYFGHLYYLFFGKFIFLLMSSLFFLFFVTFEPTLSLLACDADAHMAIANVLYLGRYIDDLIGVFLDWTKRREQPLQRRDWRKSPPHVRHRRRQRGSPRPSHQGRAGWKTVPLSLYRKPAEGHQFVHYSSAHPAALNRSLHYSQLAQNIIFCLITSTMTTPSKKLQVSTSNVVTHHRLVARTPASHPAVQKGFKKEGPRLGFIIVNSSHMDRAIISKSRYFEVTLFKQSRQSCFTFF